jgi:hypothetical protein
MEKVWYRRLRENHPRNLLMNPKNTSFLKRKKPPIASPPKMAAPKTMIQFFVLK